MLHQTMSHGLGSSYLVARCSVHQFNHCCSRKRLLDPLRRISEMATTQTTNPRYQTEAPALSEKGCVVRDPKLQSTGNSMIGGAFEPQCFGVQNSSLEPVTRNNYYAIVGFKQGLILLSYSYMTGPIYVVLPPTFHSSPLFCSRRHNHTVAVSRTVVLTAQPSEITTRPLHNHFPSLHVVIKHNSRENRAHESVSDAVTMCQDAVRLVTRGPVSLVNKPFRRYLSLNTPFSPLHPAIPPMEPRAP